MAGARWRVDEEIDVRHGAHPRRRVDGARERCSLDEHRSEVVCSEGLVDSPDGVIDEQRGRLAGAAVTNPGAGISEGFAHALNLRFVHARTLHARALRRY